MDVGVSMGTELPPPKYDARNRGDATVAVTSPKRKARFPKWQIRGGWASCAPRPPPSWKILEPLPLMAQEGSSKRGLQVNSEP